MGLQSPCVVANQIERPRVSRVQASLKALRRGAQERSAQAVDVLAKQHGVEREGVFPVPQVGAPCVVPGATTADGQPLVLTRANLLGLQRLMKKRRSVWSAKYRMDEGPLLRARDLNRDDPSGCNRQSVACEPRQILQGVDALRQDAAEQRQMRELSRREARALQRDLNVDDETIGEEVRAQRVKRAHRRVAVNERLERVAEKRRQRYQLLLQTANRWKDQSPANLEVRASHAVAYPVYSLWEPHGYGIMCTYMQWQWCGICVADDDGQCRVL